VGGFKIKKHRKKRQKKNNSVTIEQHIYDICNKLKDQQTKFESIDLVYVFTQTK
jgi:hypothetical protein